MAEHRIKITNLPDQVGRGAGKTRVVIIGANEEGETLSTATIDDFPTEFNDQMGREGKQLNVIESIEQDPGDPTFVICKIVEKWIPANEHEEFSINASDEETNIINPNQLPGSIRAV
jgi:hypothetical protein